MTSAKQETSKIGKRGVVVIPAQMRQRFGLEEGSLIIAEETDEGILIRPAHRFANSFEMALPLEIYSPERQAEFLLSNAIDEEEYEAARQEVEKMGLNPDVIPHYKP
jgi:AbrB family looped-hinge helix DNA binding protein